MTAPPVQSRRGQGRSGIAEHKSQHMPQPQPQPTPTPTSPD